MRFHLIYPLSYSVHAFPRQGSETSAVQPENDNVQRRNYTRVVSCIDILARTESRSTRWVWYGRCDGCQITAWQIISSLFACMIGLGRQGRSSLYDVCADEEHDGLADLRLVIQLRSLYSYTPPVRGDACVGFEFSVFVYDSYSVMNLTYSQLSDRDSTAQIYRVL
jgi:hypothetical protein